MRVVLQKGKQKELIELAKKGRSWKQLSEKLSVSESYLRKELRYEKCYLDEKIYRRLCKIVGKKFDRYIIKKLPDNWGRTKGGKASGGHNIKKIRYPKKSEELAEFVGIILGDGNIFSYRKRKNNRTISVYEIRICGHSKDDKNYLIDFVVPLCQQLFNIEPSIHFHENKNEVYIKLTGKEIVEFLSNIGLRPGNKIKNQLSIPKWIWSNKNFLKACLRGLFDTDGSIYELKPHWPGILQISFKNRNTRLLNDVRRALLICGFKVSSVTGDRIYITKQREVDRFFREIGLNNPKHTIKYQKVRKPRGVAARA